MAVFTANVNEWLEQAEELGKNGKVIAYLKEHPEKYFDPFNSLYPRAWEYVSKTLNGNAIELVLKHKNEIEEAFAEALGQEESRKFMEFIQQ